MALPFADFLGTALPFADFLGTFSLSLSESESSDSFLASVFESFFLSSSESSSEELSTATVFLPLDLV
jgi:hypothetical protein